MAGAPIPITDCGDNGCNALIATTGLCLADGTPIAVVTERDCETGAITQTGWIDLTTGIFTPGVPPGGTTACGTDNYEFALTGWLCDVLPDGSVAGIALVQIERDASGAVIGITLIGVDGLPYVPVGTMMRCPDDQVSAIVLCDAGNGDLPFIRFFFYDASGIIPSRDTDLDGNPYLAVGPSVQCVEGVTIENWRDDAEFVVLCDAGAAGTEFLRRYDVTELGAVTVTDTELDGVTPYAVVGPAELCAVTVTGTVDLGNQFDDEYAVLCDTVGPFLRRYRTDLAGVVTVTDLTLAGAPYVPVGAVSQCSATIAGTVTVIPAAGANVRAFRNNLVGIGVWAVGVNTHGGKIKSVSFRRRAGGAAGSVTITDNFGTVTGLLAGETETWSVEGLDDELIAPLLVTTTAAANDVVIDWTEV